MLSDSQKFQSQSESKNYLDLFVNSSKAKEPNTAVPPIPARNSLQLIKENPVIPTHPKNARLKNHSLLEPPPQAPPDQQQFN